MAANKNATSASSFPQPVLPSMEELIEKLKIPGIDIDALVDWQRKDAEALTEANRQTYEGIQALTRRRGEILRETLAQWQDALKDVAGKDSFAKQTEAAQRSVQQAVDHFRELAELEAQARTSSWKVMQDRLNENMANLQKLLLK